MSDKGSPKAGGIPLGEHMAPMGFVRGGTTTAKWDEYKKRQYHQSERHRAHQDTQRAAVQEAAKTPGISSALLSFNLGGPANPKVHLEYVYRDSALNRDCVAEVLSMPNPEGGEELALVMVCLECMKRTGRQDDSQLLIRESVRKFWLDTSKAGHWVDQLGHFWQIAGTITTAGRIHCDARGCTYRFQIDDSKVREV
jgi:hypothetical protein